MRQVIGCSLDYTVDVKGETLTVNTGSVIYSPFSVKPEVFFIKLGYVIAYTHDSDGKRRIHLIYGPGSYFPVITSFKDTEQRATYESITTVILTKVSRREFKAELKRNHDFSNLMLGKTVDQLGIFADRVIDLQLTKLEDKLLHRLTIMAKAHGIPNHQGIHLPYKLKHYLLADMLGVERESVSRALLSLKKKGDITSDPDGFIVIL